MTTAIVITALILALTLFGAVMAIRRLSGAARWVLGIAGILFACLLVFVLAGEVMIQNYMPKYTKFDPSKYHGPSGRIATTLKGDLILSVFKNKSQCMPEMLSVDGKDGCFILPAGEYRMLSCMQSVNLKGSVWRLSSSANRTLTVGENSTQDLNFGPPYMASISVGRSSGDRASFNLKIVGRGGETCSIRHDMDSKPPRFQILSQSGKLLQEGSFKFG